MLCLAALEQTCRCWKRGNGDKVLAGIGMVAQVKSTAGERVTARHDGSCEHLWFSGEAGSRTVDGAEDDGIGFPILSPRGKIGCQSAEVVSNWGDKQCGRGQPFPLFNTVPLGTRLRGEQVAHSSQIHGPEICGKPLTWERREECKFIHVLGSRIWGTGTLSGSLFLNSACGMFIELAFFPIREVRLPDPQKEGRQLSLAWRWTWLASFKMNLRLLTTSSIRDFNDPAFWKSDEPVASDSSWSCRAAVLGSSVDTARSKGLLQDRDVSNTHRYIYICRRNA